MNPNSTVTDRRLVWTPELVERFWNGVEASPLAEHSFSRLAGPSLIEFLHPYLRAEGRHLDFGAGDGSLAWNLCQRGYAVAAYEPATERAAALTARLRDESRFLGVVDPAAADSFDVVLMVEVIEHILEDQLDGALRRLQRLVRPGGTLIVTTPNNEDLDAAMVVCPQTGQLFHRWQHVRSFTRDSLAELLGRYGFTSIADHEFDASLPLTPPAEQRRTPRAILGTVARVVRSSRVARRVMLGEPFRGKPGTTLVMIASRGAEAAPGPA